MDTYTNLLLKPFFDVPNYLQANLVNDRPLSLVDLDAILWGIVSVTLSQSNFWSNI